MPAFGEAGANRAPGLSYFQWRGPRMPGMQMYRPLAVMLKQAEDDGGPSQGKAVGPGSDSRAEDGQ